MVWLFYRAQIQQFAGNKTSRGMGPKCTHKALWVKVLPFVSAAENQPITAYIALCEVKHNQLATSLNKTEMYSLNVTIYATQVTTSRENRNNLIIFTIMCTTNMANYPHDIYSNMRLSHMHDAPKKYFSWLFQRYFSWLFIKPVRVEFATNFFHWILSQHLSSPGILGRPQASQWRIPQVRRRIRHFYVQR